MLYKILYSYLYHDKRAGLLSSISIVYNIYTIEMLLGSFFCALLSGIQIDYRLQTCMKNGMLYHNMILWFIIMIEKIFQVGCVCVCVVVWFFTTCFATLHTTYIIIYVCVWRCLVWKWKLFQWMKNRYNIWL